MPAAELADVGLVHGAGVDGFAVDVGPRRRPDGHLAADAIGRIHAVVDQLDPGECAVAVDALGNQRHRRDVAVVEQRGDFVRHIDTLGIFDVAPPDAFDGIDDVVAEFAFEPVTALAPDTQNLDCLAAALEVPGQGADLADDGAVEAAA